MMEAAAKRMGEAWIDGMRSRLDASSLASATIARSTAEGEKMDIGKSRMMGTIRQDRLNEAKRSFNRIGEFAGDAGHVTEPDFHAMAGALIVIAEQGEERIELERIRNELHHRSVSGSEKASERADERSREMIEAAIGRAVGDDEGFRHELTMDKPIPRERLATAGPYERGFFRGYERGELDERERWTGSDLLTVASREFENGRKAGWRDALEFMKGSLTQELIDAALEMGDHHAGLHAEAPCRHQDHVARLRDAAKAWREAIEHRR